MMKLKNFLILYFVFFSGLVFAVDVMTADRIVIFPKEYMEKKTIVPSTISYWTPTAEQIKKIYIPSYLYKTGFSPEIIENIDDYVYQCYGMIMNGEKLIFFQVVCPDKYKESWQDELYPIKGSGNGFYISVSSITSDSK